ncbi:hypothetical protein [Neorhodopirellula pilleata]|uniref:Uncharacterized protein n=1 Tax=Neorhodopirellula pilleata TaxID=2714738 RepID=A0A5C5ZY58_9BACT|nr:hypothetical protein [Neorhodopirellula pilleata]TWT92604.1 hypothetical protein Pla100_46240 [Neorhodopirellula pilleata]
MISSSLLEIEAWRSGFEQLPANVRSAFSPHESEAYLAGARAIIDALAATGEPIILSVLDCFTDNHPFRVYIENFHDQPEIYFGLSSVKLSHELRVKLAQPERELPLFLPSRFARLFSRISKLTCKAPHFPRLIEPRRLHVSGYDGDSWEVITYANRDSLLIHGDGSSSFFAAAGKHLSEIEATELLDAFIEEAFAIRDIFRTGSDQKGQEP